MFINKRIVTLVLFVCIVLTSCAGQATEAPTLDTNAIMTSAVETFAASVYQTQTSQALLFTDTPSSSPTMTSTPVSLDTVAPLPTWTQAPLLFLPTVFVAPTVTGTQYTPTVNPALSASGCYNLRLVLDVNYPNGSVVKSGETFTKTWKVENNGTCDWIFSFNLVFVSGDSMGGSSQRLSKNIVPGKWTEISVKLKAPINSGAYTGYWQMQTQTGTQFGATLAVSVVVGTPTKTPVPHTPTPIPTDTPVPTSYP
jgi:Ig-like domain from next to BRCA1 gene